MYICSSRIQVKSAISSRQAPNISHRSLLVEHRRELVKLVVTIHDCL